jgi:hypothetical protein
VVATSFPTISRRKEDGRSLSEVLSLLPRKAPDGPRLGKANVQLMVKSAFCSGVLPGGFSACTTISCLGQRRYFLPRKMPSYSNTNDILQQCPHEGQECPKIYAAWWLPTWPCACQIVKAHHHSGAACTLSMHPFARYCLCDSPTTINLCSAKKPVPHQKRPKPKGAFYSMS